MYVKNEIDRSRTRAYIGVRGHARGVLVAALLNSYYNSNIKFYDNQFDEASYLPPFFDIMSLVIHYWITHSTFAETSGQNKISMNHVAIDEEFPETSENS